MSEQQSQKRGVISEAQKTERPRESPEPIPPSQPVAWTFSDHKKRNTPTDQDLAVSFDERSRKKDGSSEN